MQELTDFMKLVSAEKIKVQEIKEERQKRFAPRINTSASLADFFTMISEAPRIPRKKGQPAGSDKHSDLYTYEKVRQPRNMQINHTVESEAHKSMN